ncbi:LysR family transcriptional regulator [Roseiconus nitratireducens]|uniref:LysR family transcriptional regulator n=1 Tax=Roseiconus nitratireducens TaxID=2605748 RepID=UPI00137623C2|nr:LysR family transcriptional regulator [Roseiconus nitratireducens]
MHGVLMVELRELRNLLALDEHRHFGRAAGALEISQSALSKSIQKLEAKIDAPLFHRGAIGVEPTEIGAAVVAHAARIIAGVQDLHRSVDLLRGVEIGSVSVGVGPAMAESYVTQALAAVAEQHPATQISVRVDHWGQLTEWLVSGEVDFFVADMTRADLDDALSCTPLPVEEFVWFCRANHPLARRGTVGRSDLRSFPLVTPKMPAWAIDWFSQVGSEEDSQRGSSLPTVQCENYSMLKQMVMSGNCISVALAATIREELSRGDVVVLPVDAPTLRTNAGIVQRQTHRASPLANKVIAAIQDLAARRSDPLH